MKIRNYFIGGLLLIAGFGMVSCDENTTDDNGNNVESIYWNKSAAFRMQLRGKVKTLVTDSTRTTLFNESGNIESITYDMDGDETKTQYIYAGGKLTQEIFKTTWGEETHSDTTLFTYGTSGKYLPTMPYNLMEMQLFKNVSTITRHGNTTRFEASGDSMLMISKYGNAMMEMNGGDTISFTFNGGLFPVTMRSGNRVCTFTYASDGRFLTTEETYQTFYSATGTVTSYKANSSYMLPIRIDYTENGSAYNTETFEYNENEDLISRRGSNFEQEYSGYVYDSHGNWTQRSYRYKSAGGDWSSSITEKRQLTYWE